MQRYVILMKRGKRIEEKCFLKRKNNYLCRVKTNIVCAYFHILWL